MVFYIIHIAFMYIFVSQLNAIVIHYQEEFRLVKTLSDLWEANLQCQTIYVNYGLGLYNM